MNIKVIMENGFEETEAVVLIDLLRRAEYSLETVSLTGSEKVTGSHDITIIADNLLEKSDFSKADMLLLPGGPAVNRLVENEKLLELVREFDSKGKYIAAICAAPLILEKAGVIKGKRVTSYPSVRDKLTSAQYSEDKVVVDGKIITSRGVGTAIDMGLKIVELITSQDSAAKLAEKIVYS